MIEILPFLPIWAEQIVERKNEQDPEKPSEPKMINISVDNTKCSYDINFEYKDTKNETVLKNTKKEIEVIDPKSKTIVISNPTKELININISGEKNNINLNAKEAHMFELSELEDINISITDYVKEGGN